MEAAFPGFVAILTSILPEAESRPLFLNFLRHHTCRFPPPSRLFPGLDAGLDERLKRESRDKDAVLCRAVAAVTKGHQREFLDLYLVDPIDANRWATLPAWKRPIRKGDPDDILIWKFFIMYRLNMELASTTTPWPLPSQGAQLNQLFGGFNRLTLAGFRRLYLVMTTYGAMLHAQQDVGDVVHPPWETAQ